MIVGIDPSFKGFGICKINTDKKIISTEKLDVEIKKMSFEWICYAVDQLVEKVHKNLEKDKVVLTITETPPPTAKFSAGLYALDYAMSRDILNEHECPVLGVSCSYIGHLHKKKKWNKSESVKLARDLVEKVFILNGYDCSGVKFESNQCEALLISVRGCIVKGVLEKEILAVNNNFKDELEFNLY